MKFLLSLLLLTSFTFLKAMDDEHLTTDVGPITLHVPHRQSAVDDHEGKDTEAKTPSEEINPVVIYAQKCVNHISHIKKLLDEYGEPDAIKQEIYELLGDSDDVRPRNIWRNNQNNLVAHAVNAITLKKAQQKTIAGRLALYELDLLDNPETVTISEKIKNAKTLLDQYKSQHVAALENKNTIENAHRH